jgi:uncharacterized protein (TIGR03089 family)
VTTPPDQAPDVSLAAALDTRIAASPASPLVTGYDDASGDRTELSGTTFANWVAKTANLLRDGLGVQPGDVVAVDLPLHWLLPVWLGACAAVGAVVAPGGDPAEAALAVCGPDGIEAALAAPEVMACSLRPLAMPFSEPLPAGAEDYCLEVRSYGDRFTPVSRPSPRDVAWRLADGDLAGADVLAQAVRLAEQVGLAPGGRLPTTRAPLDLDGLLAVLAVPIAVGGSVVLVSGGMDAEGLAHRRHSEGVTAELV